MSCLGVPRCRLQRLELLYFLQDSYALTEWYPKLLQVRLGHTAQLSKTYSIAVKYLHMCDKLMLELPSSTD